MLALPVFSKEDFGEIESLAGIGWDLRDFALKFKTSYAAIFRAYEEGSDDEPGNIRFHINRGRLELKSKVDMQICNKASDGNLTAIQLFKKEEEKNKVRLIKERAIYGI